MVRQVARAGADVALRFPPIERAVLARAASAGRDLVLLWHRIAPHGPQDHEVVRSVPLTEFEAQLDVLETLGEVVPISDLERPSAGRRPRFALTFDDDDPGHATVTMPILRSRQLPAIFFLSGRWHDPDAGPYWWEELEEQIRLLGRHAVASGLGLPADLTPPGIAAAIAGTGQAAVLAEAACSREVRMVSDQARQLTQAGMDVGFHTRDHPVLPLLDDKALAHALTHGTRELGDELGRPLERFAYPHGRADTRVAEAVAVAGFHAAWTTSKAVARPTDPPMLRGRWDLGRLPVDRFRDRVLRALARPAP